MSAEHVLRLYNEAGTLQAVLTDFLELAYIRRVNAPGAIGWKVNGEHPILSQLADKWLVEVYRRAEPGEAWVRQLTAHHRDEEWRATPSGYTFEGFAVDIKDMLGWRVVNYVAGIENLSMQTASPAENTMKSLITRNLGALATVATYGRKRDGVIAGVSTATNQNRGTVQTIYFHGKNVLEVLREVARTGGGDFDFYRVGTTGTNYEFEFYPGQLGTDRSASVYFAPELGNMGDPRYVIQRSSEATVAAVWGQGEAADRDYVTRTGDNYSASNDLEVYVDAKEVEKGSTGALEDKGDVRLDELKARKKFTFNPLQTPATRYGEHYDLGDLVTATNPYTAETLTYKVQAVEVSLRAGEGESIKVELSEL